MPQKTSKKKRDEYIDISVDDIVSRQKDKIVGALIRDIKIKAKNESQHQLIRSIKENEITICTGPAGSGKTFVSLAFALGLLRAANNKYCKIYLVKSVTTLKGEEIGFLKGDLREKIEPFIWSFVLNAEKILPDNNIRMLIDADIIRPFPLAYARGASLDNAIIIADEMQNITFDNARTLLTRIGENSKMILLGDSNQIDLKNKNESSLEPLLNMFKDVKGFGCIRMDENDVNVRNPIINVIEDKFNEHVEARKSRTNSTKYGE